MFLFGNDHGSFMLKNLPCTPVQQREVEQIEMKLVLLIVIIVFENIGIVVRGVW